MSTCNQCDHWNPETKECFELPKEVARWWFSDMHPEHGGVLIKLKWNEEPPVVLTDGHFGCARYSGRFDG